MVPRLPQKAERQPLGNHFSRAVNKLPRMALPRLAQKLLQEVERLTVVPKLRLLPHSRRLLPMPLPMRLPINRRLLPKLQGQPSKLGESRNSKYISHCRVLEYIRVELLKDDQTMFLPCEWGC